MAAIVAAVLVYSYCIQLYPRLVGGLSPVIIGLLAILFIVVRAIQRFSRKARISAGVTTWVEGLSQAAYAN